MAEALDSKGRTERLRQIISNKRFLESPGPGNEVPFYVCPYPPEEGAEFEKDLQGLITLLTQDGVRVLNLNLYNLALEILSKRNLLDRVVASEPNFKKIDLLTTLQGVLDPESYLIPLMENKRNSVPHEVIFLSGVGEVYPFIRSHSILNNLHRVVTDVPLILFFPGDYMTSVETGTSLDLFGHLHDDKYYRAFNILNREI